MVTSRAARTATRRDRAAEEFGARAGAALDLFELLELAWHDCHGESAPPEQVLEDVWMVAGGDLGRLVSAARLAVTDVRDLRMDADEARARSRG